jgi:hypothetical protein
VKDTSQVLCSSTSLSRSDAPRNLCKRSAMFEVPTPNLRPTMKDVEQDAEKCKPLAFLSTFPQFRAAGRLLECFPYCSVYICMHLMEGFGSVFTSLHWQCIWTSKNVLQQSHSTSLCSCFISCSDEAVEVRKHRMRCQHSMLFFLFC